VYIKANLGPVGFKREPSAGREPAASNINNRARRYIHHGTSRISAADQKNSLGIFLRAPPKAHTWSAPILVNEFDAVSFQGATDRKVVRCYHGCLVICQLGAADRCELSDERPARSSALSANERMSSSV
jgi:hypothetical protein